MYNIMLKIYWNKFLILFHNFDFWLENFLNKYGWIFYFLFLICVIGYIIIFSPPFGPNSTDVIINPVVKIPVCIAIDPHNITTVESIVIKKELEELIPLKNRDIGGVFEFDILTPPSSVEDLLNQTIVTNITIEKLPLPDQRLPEPINIAIVSDKRLSETVNSSFGWSYVYLGYVFIGITVLTGSGLVSFVTIVI